jgi:hypothetical protein
MATSWLIEASVGAVSVRPPQGGEARFVVTNQGSTGARATVDVVHDEAASGSWFTVADPHRYLFAGASEGYLVQIMVPEHAPPGSYWFQARVHSTELGFVGGFAETSRVSLTVMSGPVGELDPLTLPVQVPDVGGDEVYTAVGRLSEVGLGADIDGQIILPGEVAVIGALGTDGATGKVTSQDPTAGAPATRGDIVRLHLRIEPAVLPVEAAPPAVDLVADQEQPWGDREPVPPPDQARGGRPASP